ncbi:hypothetical protein HHI36_006848, partial [Cryptolaemus montrouzieri]
ELRRNTVNYSQRTDSSSFPHGNVRTTQEGSARSSTESSLSGCQNTLVESLNEITSSAAKEAIDNALNNIRIKSKTDENEWQTVTRKNNSQEKSRKIIICKATKKTAGNTLLRPKKKRWLYVGRVAANISEANLKKYLMDIRERNQTQKYKILHSV